MKKNSWPYLATIWILLAFLALTTTVMMGNMFILVGEILIAIFYGLFVLVALWLLTKFLQLIQTKIFEPSNKQLISFLQKYYLILVIFVFHSVFVILNWLFHSYYIGRWIPEGLWIFQFIFIAFLFLKEKSLKSITNSIWIYYANHVVSYIAMGLSLYYVLSSILG